MKNVRERAQCTKGSWKNESKRDGEEQGILDEEVTKEYHDR